MFQKRKTLLAVLSALILLPGVLLAFFWNRPDQHGVRFTKISTKPPHVIYHRGHYLPVPGGKLLHALELQLERMGFDPNLVRSQEFSFDEDWCILLGLHGPMVGRYFARITTAVSTNETHMTGAWSTMDSTEHLIFWRLKSLPPDQQPVVIELFDKSSGVKLAKHRVKNP